MNPNETKYQVCLYDYGIAVYFGKWGGVSRKIELPIQMLGGHASIDSPDDMTYDEVKAVFRMFGAEAPTVDELIQSTISNQNKNGRR